MITKTEVERLFEYRRDTGDFVWRISAGTVKFGKRAGADQHSRGRSYRQIKINKKYHKVHKLVWLMEHNEWPDFIIDHIDGDGLNNRIPNLRRCTMSQNKANSLSYKNNKSGHKGVFYNKKLNRWTASIQCGGRRHFLGAFRTKEEAAIQYMASATLLFGEFARAG